MNTNPLLTVITAALAFGAGVMGTLHSIEDYAASPAKPTEPTAEVLPAATLPATAAVLPDMANIPGAKIPPVTPPTGETAKGGPHEPPAALTAGMSPGAAALSLGNWYYDHEQWESAIDNYATAIAGGIDDSNVRTDLGNALRFGGHANDALKQYQVAQRKDPTHEQSLFNQGALYAISLKKPRQGVEVWKAYLKRFPKGDSAKQARELIAKFANAR